MAHKKSSEKAHNVGSNEEKAKEEVNLDLVVEEAPAEFEHDDVMFGEDIFGESAHAKSSEESSSTDSADESLEEDQIEEPLAEILKESTE